VTGDGGEKESSRGGDLWKSRPIFKKFVPKKRSGNNKNSLTGRCVKRVSTIDLWSAEEGNGEDGNGRASQPGEEGPLEGNEKKNAPGTFHRLNLTHHGSGTKFTTKEEKLQEQFSSRHGPPWENL